MFEKLTVADLPRMYRVMNRLERAEQRSLQRLTQANLFMSVMGMNLNLITPGKQQIRFALAKRTSELEVQRCYTERGLYCNADLKRYNELVCCLSRRAKVKRNILRQYHLSALEYFDLIF